MAWKVELDRAAERELDKIDPQAARRILSFLFDRVAKLDDPRSIGEALKGSTLAFESKVARPLSDRSLTPSSEAVIFL